MAKVSYVSQSTRRTWRQFFHKQILVKTITVSREYASRSFIQVLVYADQGMNKDRWPVTRTWKKRIQETIISINKYSYLFLFIQSSCRYCFQIFVVWKIYVNFEENQLFIEQSFELNEQSFEFFEFFDYCSSLHLYLLCHIFKNLFINDIFKVLTLDNVEGLVHLCHPSIMVDL